MNKTKASLIAMSHLSDAQELIIRRLMIEGNQHINFVKYLIFHLGGDLSVEIDGDAWFAKFLESASNTDIYKDKG